MNTNPFFVLEDDPTPARTSQIARATTLVAAALKFCQSVRRGSLDPDMSRTTPLCMCQYPKVPLPPPPLALCLPATPRAVGQLPPALTPDLPAAAVWDDTDPAAGAGRGGAVARVAEHGCDVARAAVRRGGV